MDSGCKPTHEEHVTCVAPAKPVLSVDAAQAISLFKVRLIPFICMDYTDYLDAQVHSDKHHSCCDYHQCCHIAL